MRGRWLIALVILLGGWGALEFVLWQSELGQYAESPQRLELRQGTTALVAGGTAGVVYEDHRLRKDARILVRCKDEQQRFRLRRGEIAPAACGVRVRLLDLLPGDSVALEVHWGDSLDDLAPGGASNLETIP